MIPYKIPVHLKKRPIGNTRLTNKFARHSHTSRRIREICLFWYASGSKNSKELQIFVIIKVTGLRTNYSVVRQKIDAFY